MEIKKYQQRYISYSTAHGKTPEQMIACDKHKFPGGCMCGFILWIGSKLQEYKKTDTNAFVGDFLQDHDGFTKYLSQ